MSTTLERIRNEARTLPLDEREALLAVLDFDLHGDRGQTAADPQVETAWDEEIAARMKEVEDGTVTLLTTAEFDRGTDQLFAELGIQRRT